MSRKTDKNNLSESSSRISQEVYENSLHKLQIELVKLQRHFIKYNEKILVIFEGRDASGKDGTIKRIVQHLSPRETRVVALGKPSACSPGTGTVQSQLVQPGRCRAGNGLLYRHRIQRIHRLGVRVRAYVGLLRYQALQVLSRYQQTRAEETPE